MFKKAKKGKNNIKAKKAIILFFLFIFIIILILLIAIHTSKIGIEIEKFDLDTEKTKGHKISPKSKIYILIFIFGKIKIFKKQLKKVKTNKVKVKKNEIDIKILKYRKLNINYKELFENIKIEIKNIDLEVQIGLRDAANTAIVTGTIAGIIGIILRKPKYQIIPIYADKDLLKIKLDGIFTVYLMHYIYSQIFKKKRRVDKNERTSNRKSYDDCYE